MTLAIEQRGAQFSENRRWRYALWRTWEEGVGHVMFIGLNPSTADENLDDPTIRRCVGFAKAWGYGGIYMLNLFALRATDPRELKRAFKSQIGQAAYYAPVGPKNDEFIEMYAQTSALIIAAWGEHGAFLNRAWHVLDFLPEVECLAINKSGQPKHPLYVPSSAKPIPYNLSPKEGQP